jgi:acetylornithine deacetylase
MPISRAASSTMLAIWMSINTHDDPAVALSFWQLSNIMAALTQLLGLLLLTFVSAEPQASHVSASTRTATTSTSPSAVPSLTTGERDELFSLHEKLVSIPSISNDEVKCAEYISEYLEELGYYVEKVPVGNTSTYNVFAYPQALKDEGFWPEVLISSHIDTVCPN